MGYSPWACKESDMTESHTHTHTSLCNQEVALFMNVLKENRSKCHKNPLKDLKVFANEKRE